MKIIKYQFVSCVVNRGTEENPEYEDVLEDKEIHCAETQLESNLEAAKKEAYSEPTIEDDGQPEAQPTDAERIAELEEALEMLLSGVTE